MGKGPRRAHTSTINGRPSPQCGEGLFIETAANECRFIGLLFGYTDLRKQGDDPQSERSVPNVRDRICERPCGGLPGRRILLFRGHPGGSGAGDRRDDGVRAAYSGRFQGGKRGSFLRDSSDRVGQKPDSFCTSCSSRPRRRLPLLPPMLLAGFIARRSSSRGSCRRGCSSRRFHTRSRASDNCCRHWRWARGRGPAGLGRRCPGCCSPARQR